MTITGTDLVGNQSTMVSFTGPAGTFTVEPSLASATSLTVWVPQEVAARVGTYSVFVIAQDAGLNPRQIGPVTFNIIDRPLGGPPLLFDPEVVVAEADGPNGSVVSFTPSAINPDGQTVPVQCNPPSGTLFPLGSTVVVCTASNSSGSATVDFVVVVADTRPPTLVVPADIVTTNPIVTFTVTATDNIDGPIAPFCSPASGSTFAIGTTPVNCTASDTRGNSTSGSFEVTVVGPPPVLTLPANITREATGPAGAVVTYAATASGGATVTCSPASGSTFPLGTTAVNCSATNAGGTTTGSFNVKVVDTTPPALTLPATRSAEASSPGGATVSYVATASDLVDGSVPANCTPPSGSTFPIGTTTVQCNASDSRGNTAGGTFLVVVRDTTAPVITSISATPNSLWPPNHQMVAVSVTVQTTDAGDPAPVSRIINVISNQPVNGTGDGDTAPDWVIVGPLTLQLRSERAGNSSGDRNYRITVQTVDASGNSTTGIVDVRVVHSRARGVR